MSTAAYHCLLDVSNPFYTCLFLDSESFVSVFLNKCMGAQRSEYDSLLSSSVLACLNFHGNNCRHRCFLFLLRPFCVDLLSFEKAFFATLMYCVVHQNRRFVHIHHTWVVSRDPHQSVTVEFAAAHLLGGVKTSPSCHFSIGTQNSNGLQLLHRSPPLPPHSSMSKFIQPFQVSLSRRLDCRIPIKTSTLTSSSVVVVRIFAPRTGRILCPLMKKFFFVSAPPIETLKCSGHVLPKSQKCDKKCWTHVCVELTRTSEGNFVLRGGRGGRGGRGRRRGTEKWVGGWRFMCCSHSTHPV